MGTCRQEAGRGWAGLEAWQPAGLRLRVSSELPPQPKGLPAAAVPLPRSWPTPGARLDVAVDALLPVQVGQRMQHLRRVGKMKGEVGRMKDEVGQIKDEVGSMRDM